LPLLKKPAKVGRCKPDICHTTQKSEAKGLQ